MGVTMNPDNSSARDVPRRWSSGLDMLQPVTITNGGHADESNKFYAVPRAHTWKECGARTDSNQGGVASAQSTARGRSRCGGLTDAYGMVRGRSRTC